MVHPPAFPSVQSKLDLAGEQYKQNVSSWRPVLQKFETLLDAVGKEGDEQSVQRHRERGQLLARDRIALLLDPDSPFLELGAFSGFGVETSSPCASLIAGIGSVNHRPCLIMSHIPTQKGGAWNEITVLKQSRIMEIGLENDLPLISLVQSAGVFLPQQFRVFHKGGELFRDLSLRSQRGRPSCAVVFGSSTAGGAYHPALSDYTIFVENQAQVFLGGPPLVKMATGEIVDAEELGGAKMHSTVTGLADQIACDEFDAIQKVRDWVGTLSTKQGSWSGSERIMQPPRYQLDDLLSIVNPDIRKPFDMGEVLLRLVDDSRLAIFKPRYGKNIITAWANLTGHTVGIIANQTPIINPEEAAKAATFIAMCNQQNQPIIFLHNVTGFMVGTRAEHASIIKKGAQLVSAVSCSTVPHISIILGASYGAGNYAMCGRAYRPRFIFTWPTGRCSVMGPDQLSGVMETVHIASAQRKGNTDLTKIRKEVNRFRDEVQRDSKCYTTSGVVLDDGVIDPRDTREVLGMCLDVVKLEGIKGSASFSSLARL